MAVAVGRARARRSRAARATWVVFVLNEARSCGQRRSVNGCARARAALCSRSAVTPRLRWRSDSTGMSRVRCDGWRAGAGEGLARSWWTISERPFGTRLRCVTRVYLSVCRLSVPLSDSVDVGVLLYDVARVGPGFKLFRDRH